MTIYEGDLIRVTARFKNAVSGDIDNVWFFRVKSGTSDTDANCITDLTGFLDTFYSGLATHISNDQVPYDLRFDTVEWDGTKVVTRRNFGTQTWVLTTNPSYGGDSAAQFVSGIMNFRTTFPKVFGRKYLGALGEGDLDAGRMLSGLTSAIASLAAAFVADLVGGTLTYHAGVITYKATLTDYFTDFVGVVVNAVLGAQRRRRINRGS